MLLLFSVPKPTWPLPGMCYATNTATFTPWHSNACRTAHVAAPPSTGRSASTASIMHRWVEACGAGRQDRGGWGSGGSGQADNEKGSRRVGAASTAPTTHRWGEGSGSGMGTGVRQGKGRGREWGRKMREDGCGKAAQRGRELARPPSVLAPDQAAFRSPKQRHMTCLGHTHCLPPLDALLPPLPPPVPFRQR